jgi:glycosyltransferase involved in cell wall biosynthesis
MEENKIFSVIIPVYNGEKTIERALASLISNKNWIYEVIIVNDHCTDSTLEKIQPFYQWLPITIVDNNERQNPGVSRKIGLLNAHGEWVIFLDADDCLVATSLKYVRETIIDAQKDDPLVIYPLRITYNIGYFYQNSVEFYELSCVGNFYKLDYLIQNNLFPSDTLPLAEDEYYGQKIQIYINHCDHRLNSLIGYPYPVYEIHHDDLNSLSLTNWVEYLLHYHLLYQQELTNDFLQYPNMLTILQNSYTENFILCYFLYLCLLKDDTFDDVEINSQLIYFQDALQFAEEVLIINKEYMIDYFFEHEEIIKEIIQAAMVSTKVTELPEDWSFELFITKIEKMLYSRIL